MVPGRRQGKCKRRACRQPGTILMRSLSPQLRGTIERRDTALASPLLGLTFFEVFQQHRRGSSVAGRAGALACRSTGGGAMRPGKAVSAQLIHPSRLWYWVAGAALVGSAVWLALG